STTRSASTLADRALAARTQTLLSHVGERPPAPLAWPVRTFPHLGRGTLPGPQRNGGDEKEICQLLLVTLGDLPCHPGRHGEGDVRLGGLADLLGGPFLLQGKVHHLTQRLEVAELLLERIGNQARLRGGKAGEKDARRLPAWTNRHASSAVNERAGASRRHRSWTMRYRTVWAARRSGQR